MQLPTNDADVERIVLNSRLVAGVRTLLASSERICAQSRTAALVGRWSPRDLAVALAVASLVHALMVTFVPAASAPLWRYLFAGLGFAAAALVAVAARVGGDDVRDLR
jgi:hypothetical protein